jgi:hypothetical protein
MTSTVTPNKCMAITITGHRCTRNVVAGTNYCWQHQNYEKPVATTKSNGSYFDLTTFSILLNNYKKNYLNNKDLEQIVAMGPFNIYFEAKNYIKLPNIQIQCSNIKYDFQTILILILDQMSKNFTYDYFNNLIHNEQKIIETGNNTAKNNAIAAQATYSAIFELYDPDNPLQLLSFATFTGPSATGDYYVRFPDYISDVMLMSSPKSPKSE